MWLVPDWKITYWKSWTQKPIKNSQKLYEVLSTHEIHTEMFMPTAQIPEELVYFKFRDKFLNNSLIFFTFMTLSCSDWHGY